MALFGSPSAVDTIPVTLAGFDVSDQTMPNKRCPLMQSHTIRLVPFPIEEANGNGSGMLRKQGEIRSNRLWSGSKRVGSSGQQCPFHLSLFQLSKRFTPMDACRVVDAA